MSSSSSKALPGVTIMAAVAIAITAPAVRAQQVAQSADSEASLQEVIVTGTRQSGVSAAESPAPIQILSADALKAASGNPDLMSTLAQIVPSLTMEAFGLDMAGQTLLAKLRGMSPNQVLVLVNGKRRHTTANISVDTDQQDGSPFSGGAGVDLNFIPVEAIDHIEVLTDGAAAQYGTDALAGVINIILKKSSSGVTVDGTYGNYFNGGGNTGDVAANAGFEPTDGSYFNITGSVLNHGHSDQGGIDPRAFDTGTYPNSNMTQIAGYPYINHIFGDAETHTKLVLANAGLQLGDSAEFYLFGTYGDKHAASYENYRTPQRIGYTDAAGTTTYPFPFGFNPEEATHEIDWQTTGGFRGVVADWHWDLSSSYGADKVNLYTLDSIGNSYPINGEPTPSNFYDGVLETTQWTTTIDVNRDFDVGMAGPLNVAGGVEYRRETYLIGAGIPDSWQDGGAQSYAGINPVSASINDRKNEAVYIDLAGKPIDGLRLDAAGRYEHYSDFGSATVGKLTGRYDFTPQYAIRATVSNGFRAPTLAEAFYTSTNVAPSSATVSLAPDSAAVRALGLNPLNAEKSLNYSLGFVFRPLPAMTATLDLYQITITNRIVETGSINGQVNGVPNPNPATYAAVNEAIALSGNQLDQAVLKTGTVSVSTFANGIDTRTRGADLTFNFPVDYPLGHVNYTIAATYNETDVTKIPASPAALAGTTIYDPQSLSALSATPKYAINLGATWTYEKLYVNVLEKIYGPTSEYINDEGDNATSSFEYFKTTIGVTPITNLDLGYQLNKWAKLDIGAINLFNRFPPNLNPNILGHEAAAGDYTDVIHSAAFSPFGIDGGFYYARATLSF